MNLSRVALTAVACLLASCALAAPPAPKLPPSPDGVKLAWFDLAESRGDRPGKLFWQTKLTWGMNAAEIARVLSGKEEPKPTDLGAPRCLPDEWDKDRVLCRLWTDDSTRETSGWYTDFGIIYRRFPTTLILYQDMLGGFEAWVPASQRSFVIDAMVKAFGPPAVNLRPETLPGMPFARSSESKYWLTSGPVVIGFSEVQKSTGWLFSVIATDRFPPRETGTAPF